MPVSMHPALVAGVPFQVTDLDEAVGWAIRRARTPVGSGIAVRLANAFCVTMADSNPDYHRLLSTSGINFPDGAPVAWTMRRAGEPSARRVRGPSFFVETLYRGQFEGVRHYFFGADESVLASLVDEVKVRFPDAIIVGASAPDFRSDPAELASQLPADVSKETVDIVWVGLGSPKQDFVAAVIAEERGVMTAGVGAAFDFLAGSVREAPRFIQRSGLEWLFRLVSEPRRLWRRYLIGNAQFLRVALPSVLRPAPAPLPPFVETLTSPVPWGDIAAARTELPTTAPQTDPIAAPPASGSKRATSTRARSKGREPLVSVVLPAYNAGEHLAGAVRSVLADGLEDLELVVVDDGSTDGSVDALLETLVDSRLRVIRQENRGLSAALNRGFAEARGRYLARMDGDDEIIPGRLAAQGAFLDEHPTVALVGGQIDRLVDGRVESTSHFPTGHDAIVAGLEAGRHVLCHPSVMIRASAVRVVGGYWDHGVSEDWDLFLRLAEHGDLANIDQPVLRYRFHGDGINASSMATVRRNIGLAVENHRRRLAGDQELTPSDFWKAIGVLGRAAVNAQTRSLTLYRSALQAKAAGRRLRAMTALLAAGVLWPQQAMHRVSESAVGRMQSRPTAPLDAQVQVPAARSLDLITR